MAFSTEDILASFEVATRQPVEGGSSRVLKKIADRNTGGSNGKNGLSARSKTGRMLSANAHNHYKRERQP